MSNRVKIGSFIFSDDFLKSPLGKETYFVLKKFFKEKRRKKWQKGYTEIIGYSKYFPYAKCYGMIAGFKIDSFNGGIIFGGMHDGFIYMT